MNLIANKMFQLQAFASAFLSTNTSCESELYNTDRPDLLCFSLGWYGPVLSPSAWKTKPQTSHHVVWALKSILCHLNWCCFTSFYTGIFVNRVHYWFLWAYLPPQEIKYEIVWNWMDEPSKGLILNLLTPCWQLLLVKWKYLLRLLAQRSFPATKTPMGLLGDPLAPEFPISSQITPICDWIHFIVSLDNLFLPLTSLKVRLALSTIHFVSNSQL